MAAALNNERNDRARGSLCGLVWGDILGCPVEGWRSGQIAAHFGVYAELPAAYPESTQSLPDKRRRRLRPLGMYSDDGQQAMALIGCCAEGWSARAWATWLVAGKVRKAWRGTGRNFNAAVDALRRGVVPERSGSASAGMGAAMRIGPLGAAFAEEPELLAKASVESSLVTHGDLRAGMIAYAVAFAVAGLVRGERPAQIVEALPAAVRSIESEWLSGQGVWAVDRSAGHQVSDGLAAFFSDPGPDLETMRSRITAIAAPHLAAGFVKAHVNQGFALLGGLHGLAMGLLAPGAPGEVLAGIIRLGYDTDTVAAIAGSLLGARYGIDWIPRSRIIDDERVALYAEALASGGDPGETMDEFFRSEHRLTECEKASQRAS